MMLYLFIEGYLSSLQSADYLSFFAILISLIALLHTIYFNLQYSKRDIKNRQLLLVLDLIEKINCTSITVFFGKLVDGGRSGNLYTSLNLWKIANLENEEDNDDQIIFDTNSNSIFDIGSFLNHPLLPAKIYRTLIKFSTNNSYPRKSCDFPEGEYVIINTGHFVESQFNFLKNQSGHLNEVSSITYKSWLSHFKLFVKN